GGRVSWRLITYRLPAEPSRHRVAVWRELRRLGAVPLQHGTWALPEGRVFDHGLTQVIAMISEAGGRPIVLRVVDDDAGTVSLEELFTAQREAEWVEFLGDCGKYEAQLADACAKGKPTAALAGQEGLARLRHLHRAIRARDVFGAPSAADAERRLKECADALEPRTGQVRRAGERP
ncbi:MAG TPA: Chromate resistance protein ChrB, partial [Streptosporangiaceae bacterium]|nr:Chromate resistance protein ChrB [Streptosporangiaceae bacterium]